jgi:hypothetical protein
VSVSLFLPSFMYILNILYQVETKGPSGLDVCISLSGYADALYTAGQLEAAERECKRMHAIGSKLKSRSKEQMRIANEILADVKRAVVAHGPGYAEPQYRGSPGNKDGQLREGETHRECVWCGVLTVKLLKCGRCRQARVCGKQCQKRDWVLHKSTCKAPTQQGESKK